MVRWRRLLSEDVQSGPRNLSGFNRVVERAFVNQSAARAVDNAYPLLHPGKCISTNDAARFRGQRCMDGYEICAREKVFKRSQFDFQITCRFRGNERIKGYDLHPKPSRARGDGATDSSHAYNAQG